MIKIWYETKKCLKEPQSLSQFSPIWGNQFFVPGRADATFKLWETKGLRTIQDLYLSDSDDMMSFEELRSNFDLNRKHFFKYLQLRNYVKVNQDNTLAKPQHTLLEKMVMDNLRKGIISELYELIVSFSPENSKYKLNARKENLQLDISKTDWETTCAGAHTASINTRLKLIQYKWFMRTYVTPVDLNRFDRNIPDICTKCTEDRGTLFHYIWQCRKINMFWEEVRVIIEKIIMKPILLDPKLFLLGLYPENHNYRKYEKAFINLSLLNAKRCKALLWKKTHRPSVTQWLKQMLSSLPLERITYILNTFSNACY